MDTNGPSVIRASTSSHAGRPPCSVRGALCVGVVVSQEEVRDGAVEDHHADVGVLLQDTDEVGELSNGDVVDEVERRMVEGDLPPAGVGLVDHEALLGAHGASGE
ncbi:hypothetical protein ACFC09_43555 [Streptomyces sp. NPDC056161]|uniref:hypothetical protein n=1 Tax=Streptomyces sp. NPDC056161 TaxID=3345732 RepID=UPI0035D84E9A